MRTLHQPGPVHPDRIDDHAATARRLTFTAQQGLSLADSLTRPMREAGFQAGTLRFSGASLAPFRYVMPDHATDDRHVAYFSTPRAPAGVSRIEQATATFGFNAGRPFLHTHAAWIEPDGERHGGHILNEDSILLDPITVEAWGLETPRVEIAEDPETNFSLFQPAGARTAGGDAVLARVRPNQDIIGAIEIIARTHAMPNARIVGSVGSLVGTRFDDGRDIPDRATEVLVTAGEVRGGVATLDVISVDMAGRPHAGRLARGQNAVLITFDLVLLRVPA
jgi:predicted DNA-binding protein with PD1-like motif